MSSKRPRCCEWVSPFATPLERRVQTAAVLAILAVFFGSLALNVVCWLYTPLLGPYIAYVLWFLIFDRHAHITGGRTPIGRRWSLWKLYRNYFPSQVITEEDLDPEGLYVFGIHPHGVLGMAMWANMMNTVCPALVNIRYRIVTLASNFYLPISREWLLWLGLIGSDKKGILNALRKGLSVMIVVGGAAESLEIHRTYHGIVLNRRRGFVELALRTGAHLVPVFNFGENQLYNTAAENAPGSRLRRAQDWMKGLLGFTLPLVHGRGIWNYSYGLLPFRRPLVTVIGKPIPVPLVENPTREQVAFYHERYKEALLALHERWRHKVGETVELRIIA